MSRFVFRLWSVLNYRRNRRDLCRQLLAQTLADDARLELEGLTLAADRDRQLNELRRLSARGRVSVTAAAARRYHSVHLLARIRGVDRSRQLVAQQLLLCREALSKADADVKVLERLEERQRAAYVYDAERRAQREREDAWTAGRLLEAAR